MCVFVPVWACLLWPHHGNSRVRSQSNRTAKVLVNDEHEHESDDEKHSRDTGCKVDRRSKPESADDEQADPAGVEDEVAPDPKRLCRVEHGRT